MKIYLHKHSATYPHKRLLHHKSFPARSAAMSFEILFDRCSDAKGSKVWPTSSLLSSSHRWGLICCGPRNTWKNVAISARGSCDMHCQVAQPGQFQMLSSRKEIPEVREFVRFQFCRVIDEVLIVLVIQNVWRICAISSSLERLYHYYVFIWHTCKHR